ncbi:MAG: hypothetical protein ABIY70_18430 [Capsulimonas sp.]|uniref:hypothetical protein n=1 Tax=Capsulimonas sp. TaxID=2494211 RepID=UPI0032676DCA
MRRHLLPVFTLLTLAPFAHGQGPTVSQTTVLQNITAQDVPRYIQSSQKLDELTCNFHDNTVTAHGSQEAVTEFEKELHAKDVQRGQYRLTMKLVGYHVDKNGKITETATQTPSIVTTEKISASISMGGHGQDGLAITVIPSPDTDKTINLTVEIQELGEQGEVMNSGKNTQVASLGKTVHITGMTDAKDKALRRAVQKGEVVTDRGEYTGYYLEVTPTKL